MFRLSASAATVSIGSIASLEGCDSGSLSISKTGQSMAATPRVAEATVFPFLPWFPWNLCLDLFPFGFDGC